MDIVDKLNNGIAMFTEFDDLLNLLNQSKNEITNLRQQLAKPAPEAQILIDALRLAREKLKIFRKHSDGEYQGGTEYTQLMQIIYDALAAYDAKATPDNGVEK